MADEDDSIIITAQLRDELSAPAERLEQSLNDLGQAADDTATSTDNLTEAERRNEAQTERTTRANRAANQQRDAQGRFIAANTAQLESNTRALNRSIRLTDRSSKSGKSASKVFGRLTSTFMGLGKALVAMDLLAQGAAGIGALGAAGVAAASGIGQMTGVLLPLPALMTGAFQAMSVGKLAFQGMNDAVGALAKGDYAAFYEATKDMPAAMADTAKALGELGQQWKPLVKDIQAKVWEGYGETITRIGNKVMPMLRDSLMGTAGALNVAGKDFMGFLESERGMFNLNQIMRDNGVISQDFAHGIGQLGQAGVTMLAAVMPVARQMSVQLRDGAAGLNEMIQNNMGRITAFAQRGYDLFRRFLGIMVDLGIGIYNIAKHSTALSGQMGKGIEDIARKFREWTESAKGIERIKQFFVDSQGPLKAFWNLIVEVAKAFGSLQNANNSAALTDSINQIAEMVPKIAELANMAAGKLLPALLDIAQSLVDVVTQGNMIGPMSILLGVAAGAAQLLANAFLALPEPMQTVIGYLITITLLTRTLAATSVGAWILQLAAVQRLTNALKVYRAVLLMAAQATIMQAIGGIATAFKAVAAAVWGATRAVMVFLFTTPIGWIILAVIALVAAFVLLWKKCEAFRNMVKAIGAWFVDVWNNQLYPAIMATWDWIKGVWDKIYAFVKPIIMGIVNWFVQNWPMIKAVALEVFDRVKSIVMTVFNAIVGYIKFLIGYWTMVWNVAKAIFSVIWPILTTIFKAWWTVIKTYIMILVGIFKIAWSIIKLAFQIVWEIITTIFMVWWAFVKGYIIVVVAFFKAAWEAIKWAFGVAWNWILNIIRPFVAFIQGVISIVIAIWNVGWNVLKTVVGFVWGVIKAIIDTVVGWIQAVVNTVRGIWDAAWNALSGPVTTVIETVKTTVGTISSKVTEVTNAVKNAFTTAFNTVRDVVNPILEGIKNFIQTITDKVSGMKEGIQSAMQSIPVVGGLFNFAGGPAPVGQTSWVGELGPEAFVSNTGQTKLIGAHGPEQMKFNQPGYIVPNHVLNGVPDSSVPKSVMEKLANAAVPGAPMPAQTQTTRGGLSSDTYLDDVLGGGDGVSVQVIIQGNVSSDVQIEEAVRAALRKLERNKRERS